METYIILASIRFNIGFDYTLGVSEIYLGSNQYESDDLAKKDAQLMLEDYIENSYDSINKSDSSVKVEILNNYKYENFKRRTTEIEEE